MEHEQGPSSSDHSPDAVRITPLSDDFDLPVDEDEFRRSMELQSLPPDHDSDDEEDAIGGEPGQDGESGISLATTGFSRDEERSLVKSLDRNLVLLMAFLYLLSFLDRSNIGNARIAGMSTDLRLTESQWEWLLEGFYITYIAFEWMILLYNVVSAHVYISLCVLAWGLLASLQSMATSFGFMMVLRLLLGVSEAAFSPGVPFYLSFFYRREELAFRTGIMISAAPLATSFAGSLAWLITWIGVKSPIAPWRLLFLVEGFPSVLVAVFTWMHVPDSPGKAKFLTQRQRKFAKLRLQEGDETAAYSKLGEDGVPAAKAPINHLDWGDIRAALKDPKCYLTAAMFFNCNVAFSSLPVFLPTVINEMGYSSLSSQALSAPPYLVAFVVVLVTAHISDRFKARSACVCFHALLGFTGYALIALGGVFKWGNLVRYFCVYLAAAGFFSAITIIITWTINNQESNSSKGTGMTILNLVGQCGPILGTRLYPESDGPYYVTGMSVCAASMLLVFCLSAILRVFLIRKNKRSFQSMGDHETELLASGERSRQKKRKFIFII